MLPLSSSIKSLFCISRERQAGGCEGVQQKQGPMAACVDGAMAGTRIRVEREVPMLRFTGICWDHQEWSWHRGQDCRL